MNYFVSLGIFMRQGRRKQGNKITGDLYILPYELHLIEPKVFFPVLGHFISSHNLSC